MVRNHVVLSLVLCGLFFFNLAAEADLSLRAAPLESFSFGGRLSNSTGLSVAGLVNLSMTARLFESETGGTSAYIQVFPAVAVTDGFFHLLIGPALPDLLENTYLELEVAGQILLPRRKFLTQPYAIHAKIAENANNADKLSGLTLEEVEKSFFSKAGIQPLTASANLEFSSLDGDEIRAGNIAVTGVVTASQFRGDGTSLTNVLHLGDPISTTQVFARTLSDGIAILSGGVLSVNQVQAISYVGDGAGLTNLPTPDRLQSGPISIELDPSTTGSYPHIHFLIDGQEPLFISTQGVGIGVAFPTQALEVAGMVVASQFSGDGTSLTNVLHSGDAFSSPQITVTTLSGGTLSVNRVIATSTVEAQFFMGDGSDLTQVLHPGENLSVPLITGTTISDGFATLSGGILIANQVQASTFIGDGSALTGVVIQGTPLSTSQSITMSADGGKALVIEHSSSETAGTTKIAVRNLSGDTFGVTVDGDIGFFGHIRRLTSTLHGNQSFGHTNLGDSSSTGEIGQNRQYATVGGGLDNHVAGDFSVIPGGRNMRVEGADSFAFNGTGVSQTVTAGLTGSAIFMVNHMGVGTTNPTARLHIDGKIKATTVRSNWLISNQAILASSSDAPLRVVTGELPSQTVLVVTSSGRVGIGTTQPLAKLHVDGTLAALRFVGDGSQLTNLGSSSVIRDTDADTGIMVEDNPDEDSIRMGTDGLERLIITNSGDVGIGITAPLSRLHVDGVVKASGFEGDGSNLTNLPAGSAFTDNTSNIVYNAGNVGLMVSDPDEKLVVGGKLRLEATTDTASLDGTVRWSGEDFEARIDGEWVEIRTEPTNADTFSTERTAPPLPTGAYFLNRGEDLPTGFSESILTKSFDASVEQLPDLPRNNGSSSSNTVFHDGFLYMIGGFVDSDPTTNVLIYDFGSAQWTQGPSMPLLLQGMALVSHLDKIYTIGGYDSSFNRVDDVLVLDTQSNTWSTGVTLPIAKEHGAAFSDGIKIYLVGGDKAHQASDFDRDDIYSLNPDVDSSWTLVPEKLTYLYSDGTYVSAGGKIYLMGSEKLDERTKMTVYDPVGRSTTALASLPADSRQAVAFSFNNKIYLIGGSDTPTSIYEYSIANDIWTTLTLATPVDVFSTGWAQDKKNGYITGGIQKDHFLIFTSPTNQPFVQLADINDVGDDLVPFGASILTRDPTTPTGYTALNESVDIAGQITTLANFPHDFLNTANNMMFADNKIYTFFGYINGAHSNTSYVYDLTSDSWTVESTATGFAGRRHNSAVYHQGNFYAIGGLLGPSDTYSSEVLEYSTQAGWTALANLPLALQQTEAVSLNSEIYAIGGHTGSLQKATVYALDPTPGNNTWVTKSSMNVDRTQHCAVVLNGKIYVFGGSPSTTQAKSREVYDSASDSWTLFSNEIPESFAGHKCAVIDERIYLIGGGDLSSARDRVVEFNPETLAYTTMSVTYPELTQAGFAVAFDDKSAYVLGNNPQTSLFRKLEPGGFLFVHQNTVGGQGADLSKSLAVVHTTSNAINGFDSTGDSLEASSTQDFFLHFRSDAKLLSLVGILDEFRDDDGDSGLFMSSDQNQNTVVLRSGGTERIRIDGDGSLDLKSDYVDVTGILTLGTTAETNAVDGAIRFTGTDLEFKSSGVWNRLNNQQSNQLADADGNTSIKLDDPATPDNIEFKNNGTLSMTLDSSGKVGIGTATPVALVDVNGAIRIGDTAVPNPGTIRFNGEGFEGHNGASWVNFGGSVSFSGAGDQSFIGGGSGNTATTTGSFVGAGMNNEATGLKSFVGSGDGNEANGQYSNVVGGQDNEAMGQYSNVVGGQDNEASADHSFVGGGNANSASGIKSFVGGGLTNEASGTFASVAGGTQNTASGIYAIAAGGTENQATGSSSTIAGGYQNQASSPFSAIGGGQQNNAGGESTVIVGGKRNTTTNDYASIGGGFENTATAEYTTIGGGKNNNATQNYATVGGGEDNMATGQWSLIAGGSYNAISGDYGAVGGGKKNYIGVAGTSDYSAISGGHSNSITGVSSYSFIGGGEFNEIQDSLYAVNAGGEKNHVLANYGSVGGGKMNTASGNYSWIGGGRENIASGLNSAVIGGRGLALSGQGSMGFRGGNNAAQITRSALDTVFFMEAALCVGATTSDCTSSSYPQGVILANGMGLNTTSPDATLHVVNSDITTSVAFDSGFNTHLLVENAGHSYLGVRADNDSASGIHFGNEDGLTARIAYLGTSDSMHFSVDGDNFTDHLVIASDGNIGLGKSKPTTTLDVEGGGQFSTGMNIGFSGTPTADTVSIGDANHAVSLNTNGDPVYAFDVNDFMGYIRSSDQLRFVVNNADAIRILSDGKVGIGTSTPGTKLEVSGKILATSMESTGAVTATTFYGDGSNLTNLPAPGAGQTIGSTGVLFDQIFISRDVDNNLYGTGANTHVNLGIDSDTGESGQNHSYSSVAGGFRNTASNWYAFVGGGTLNQASGQNAVVSGGKNNIASNFQTTVGGGFNNIASGSHSTIGGGLDNTASGLWTSVSGGRENTATGQNSVIVGGRGLRLDGQGSMGFRGGDNESQITRSAPDTVYFMETGLCVAELSTDCFESSFGLGTIVAQGTHISISNTGEARYHLYNQGGVGEWKMGQKNNTEHNFQLTKIISGTEFDYVTVDTSGNMSVGTTGSFGKLTVDGDLISIYRNAAAGEARYHLYNGGATAGWMIGQPSATDHGFTISKDVANVITDYFHISEASGNIGIGTTSPATKLDVAGNAVFKAETGGVTNLAIDSYAANAVSRIELKNNGVSKWLIDSRGTAEAVNDRLAIFNATPTESFTFLQNGNLGIGNINPDNRLVVIGDVRIGVSGTNGCVKRFDGNGIVGTCASDRRFKKNISPLVGSLDRIDSIQPVSFDWRRDEFKDRNFSVNRTLGFIAQDFEKTFPELVDTNDDGYKAVNYGMELQMHSIQAIKELKQKLDKKDHEIIALKNLFKTQDLRLQMLEKRLNFLLQNQN
jgi:hypothetical protein